MPVLQEKQKELNRKIINELGNINTIQDGAIDSEKYEYARVKILFVGLESYGYDEDGYGKGNPLLSSLYAGWIKARKAKTFRNSAVFASVLFNYLERRKASEDEIFFDKLLFQSKAADKPRLIEEFGKVAFINLRKTSNSKSKASIDIIRKEAIKLKLLISDQIQLLKPDVIITNGKAATDILYNSLRIKECLKVNREELDSEPLYIPLVHFRIVSYKYMHDYALKICDLLNGKN